MSNDTAAPPANGRAALAQYLSGADEADMIGCVFSWSISAGAVTFHDVERWFAALGLDPKHLPKKNRPVDAFRTATTDTSIDYVMADGRRATLMFEETDSDDKKVYRKIVRRIRDANKHALEYEPNVGSADYYHSAESAKFAINERALCAGEKQYVEQIIAEANTKFHHRKEYLNHAKLARIVRDYLKAMNAVPLRPSGGIYFIHKSRQPTVEALHQLIENFGTGSTVVLVPLPDTTYSREKVLQSLDDDMSKELSKLVAAINDVQAAKKAGEDVSEDKFTKLHSQIVGITGRLTEHQRALGTQEMQARDLLAAATQALMSAQVA